MATTSTRGKNPQTAQPLFWLLWQDALLEWGLPVTLIGAIICFALLGAFEQIAQTTGILTLGGLLLLLVCFLLFKPTLTNAIETKLKSFTWGLALAWLAITCVQFYFSIFVGQEITSRAITKDSSGMELTLGAQGTIYDLVIEGNFSTAVGQGGREGGYTLLLEKDGQRLQELTSNFSETLARQRLGRRGSTTTHRLHNHSLHSLVSPGEGTYHLTVARIDPQLTPTLQVFLYRDTYPQKTFWLLNALLLIGAYIGETWQATVEIPLVLVTAAALMFVVTFRNIGVPPHSYQDIIGAFLVAALAGPL
ncbi:MAG: hypothetical protein AB7P69_23625, partial [Candidatus Binatia bacterium]